MEGMGRSQDGRFVARFSLGGAGTRESPAVLRFNLGTHYVSPQQLREQLPPTVTAVKIENFYNLKGTDPTMSRSELADVFYDLTRKNYWCTRYFA